MCKYINVFLAQLFLLTLMSFTSCDDIDRILFGYSDTTRYDGSSNDNDGYGDNAQNDGNSQTSANNSENNTGNSQSNPVDTVPNSATIPVQSVIVENKQNEQDSIISDLNNRIGYLESKNARMIESSTVYALMLFNCLLLIVLFYFLSRKINALKKRICNSLGHDNNGDGAITQNTVRLLIRDRIDDLTKQINGNNKTQDDKNREFDKRLKKLEMKGDPYSGYFAGTGAGKDKSQNSSSESSSKVSSTSENVDGSSKSNTFYMPRTMVPLQFEDSKKKYSRSENTYFKFVIMKDNQALFFFDPFDETCIKRAFDDRDNSLATVCDIELVSSQPRGFKNDGNGHAELRNGVWVVTKKLKLQYV